MILHFFTFFSELGTTITFDHFMPSPGYLKSRSSCPLSKRVWHPASRRIPPKTFNQLYVQKFKVIWNQVTHLDVAPPRSSPGVKSHKHIIYQVLRGQVDKKLNSYNTYVYPTKRPDYFVKIRAQKSWVRIIFKHTLSLDIASPRLQKPGVLSHKHLTCSGAMLTSQSLLLTCQRQNVTFRFCLNSSQSYLYLRCNDSYQ